ncbi:MAG: RhuM family protein [Bacilli bacterium]
MKESSVVQTEGERQVKRKIKLYNLDMIISVGYRVKSKNGIIFRRWANKLLKEYLLKGFIINENRVIVSNENYVELKNEVTSINTRLLEVKNRLD